MRKRVKARSHDAQENGGGQHRRNGERQGAVGWRATLDTFRTFLARQDNYSEVLT